MEEIDMLSTSLLATSVIFCYVCFVYGVRIGVTALINYLHQSASTVGGGVSSEDDVQYKIISVCPDGRCLFRALVHGSCLRNGLAVPGKTREGELADYLRARVMDELGRRKDEFNEWGLGDFDEYVERMQNPIEWGGEPELLMASHVLQTPISVSIIENSSGNLVNITNYGQEYENNHRPIELLFRDSEHYDLLEILSDVSSQKLESEENFLDVLSEESSQKFESEEIARMDDCVPSAKVVSLVSDEIQ